MELILIVIALFERLVVDFGPNIELVTTACVLSGLYFGKRASWMVPISIMLVSDLVLGMGIISWFTWTGFVLIAWLPRWLFVKKSPMMRGLSVAMLGNLAFYFWTNFGVWLTDRWGMYANDLGGLWLSYVNGLPFLKMQLFSSLLFVPMGIFLMELGVYVVNVWRTKTKAVLKQGFIN